MDRKWEELPTPADLNQWDSELSRHNPGDSVREYTPERLRFWDPMILFRTL